MKTYYSGRDSGVRHIVLSGFLSWLMIRRDFYVPVAETFHGARPGEFRRSNPDLATVGRSAGLRKYSCRLDR